MQKDIKMVYSLRVRNLLSLKGFNYLKEVDNPQKEGFKCWLYEDTPEFETAFLTIAGKRGGK